MALGLALASDDPAVDGLRRYERVRAARTRRIVRTGPQIARVTTTRNKAIAWLRETGIRLAPIRPLLAAFLIDRATDPPANSDARDSARGYRRSPPSEVTSGSYI